MYGKRLIKKSDRLAVQQNEFGRLLDKNYDQETYKGLNIFVKDENGKYYLSVFRDTSSKPIANYYYRLKDQRDKAIESFKSGYDKRQAYKEESKKDKTLSTAANCAAAIREELKEHFPGVKFYVKSSNFSMGNSVDVSYEDGPTLDSVELVTGKYQYGHFNGMEDIYENSNSRDDIPQAKYVSAHRSMSAQTKSILEPIANELFKDDDNHRWGGNTLYRLFQKTSIPVGAKVLGIERTEKTCGQAEDFYYINVERLEKEEKKSLPSPDSFDKKEFDKPGEISIIEYGPKSFAVVGDTRPLAPKLGKNGLRGWFTYKLPGWVFPNARLQEVQTFLSGLNSEEPPKEEPEPEQTTNEVKEYDNLQDLEQAAKGGKVVSLLNMYNLVNAK